MNMPDQETLLSANLEFLKSHSCGSTCEEIRKAATGGSPVAVTPSGDGFRVTSVREGSTARIDLHSARAPREEAIRQIHSWAESCGVTWKGTVAVLGFGGGWHLEVISALAREGALILVIDPDPSAVRQVLEVVDVRRMEPTGACLRFIVSTDTRRLAHLFRCAIEMRHGIGVSIFCHPGLFRASPTLFNSLHDEVVKEFRCEAMNRGTFAVKSAEWQANKMENLPWSLANPGIDVLKGRFAGSPGFVVAAGPSLNDSMSQIARGKGRVPIIAVGTALKPLLSAGVRPDFVMSVDASEKIWRQFAGADASPAYLLAETITYPPVVEMFKDRLFSFSSGALGEFDTWLGSFGARPATMMAGGTVTVCAIDAAVYLGLNPIYVFGLDLAYGGDGASHAAGSVYDGGGYPRQPMVEVPGNYSEKAVTTKQFALYINIVEAFVGDLSARSKATIINVNTRGARIKTMRLIRPSEIPETIYDSAVDALSVTQLVRTGCAGVERAKALEAWNGLSRSLDVVMGLAERASSLCATAAASAADTPKRASLMSELDGIDAKLKREKTALNLINGVLKSVCMDILGKEFVPTSETDSFLRNIERIGMFYTHVKTASEWVAKSLGRAFDKYEASSV